MTERSKRKPYRTRMMKQGVTIRDEFGTVRGFGSSENYLEMNLVSHYSRFAKIAWNVEDETLTVLGYGDDVIVELSAKQLGHGEIQPIQTI